MTSKREELDAVVERAQPHGYQDGRGFALVGKARPNSLRTACCPAAAVAFPSTRTPVTTISAIILGADYERRGQRGGLALESGWGREEDQPF